MKRTNLLTLLLVVLFTQCGLISNKKQKQEVKNEPEVVKTQEEILAEEKMRQDSIENAALELIQKKAFGDLIFGMEKELVEKTNEKRQLLGKYNYNFSYSFNENDELYKLKISSDGVKAIQFESDLKSRYQNLYQIIKTKYGEPLSNRKFPSIFDVQNSKKYQLNNWEAGTKQINLGLQENGTNSYSVICEIFDKNMNESETNRLRDAKNSDVIESSKKF